MHNTSGTLFTFLEDVFALRGFGASGRTANGAENDDLSRFTRFRKCAMAPGAAGVNAARGLTPLVSVAVSVCPVPPVANRAPG